MDFKKPKGIYKAQYRNGPSHRAGADVTFNDIVKMFGFRTATVGAWVKKEEQQIAANLFFDALCDLMTILQVPEQVISLNGTLSIAFGKGGNKYSSAHYNASTRTLALAKNAGAGSLAHEYFHAFDHFIASKLFPLARAQDFASALWLSNHQVNDHPLNRYLADCFQHIFLKQNSEEPSELVTRSIQADKSLNSLYFALPQELCARAFESFVQDQQIKNSFLVRGTKESVEAKMGVYPLGEQRPLLGDYFLRYFSALGQALDYKYANSK